MSSRGPRLGTLIRLASAGSRVDGIRVGLTVVGAAAASFVLLLASAVASIGPRNGPYRLDILQQSGLRPGVIVVLALLCIPILNFVAQCSRIGAPARDRRLAALRMAGGTPSEVRRIVAMEAGLASLIGALVGGLGYLITRQLAGTASQGMAASGDGTIVSSAPNGRLLPTDVMPHLWLIVIALLLVPVLATVGSVVALRRTAITPFGVIHREAHRPPSATPAALFLIGTVGLAAWQGIYALLPGSVDNSVWLLPVSTILLLVLTLTGLIYGSASVAYHLGRAIAPRTSRASLLIAARRMIDAPFTASRATTVVTFAVLLGSGVEGIRAAILVITQDNDESFYVDTFDLLNLMLVVAIALATAGLLVTATEGVVTRRRTLAALKAGGTPRRTLAAATLWETVLPLVPTIALATTAGLLGARGLMGTSVRSSSGTSNAMHVVPVPWGSLGLLAGGTVAAAVLVTAVSLVFLPRSTSITELRTAA
ncbi:FtsX-like permease family protein [Leekyejoonella antrihumi]|uniref:FtsX-like permease family protein n=1 Tax=Leekyejoonella antrihumi TaxID=1660198 RepID=A0A563DXG4_9MICO|nr:FtsX-like permease family protein [Leekyejoonella antrihumi]TWP34950.1 FtsX-like permease family protein [Leekyejoonella antrihumi]